MMRYLPLSCLGLIAAASFVTAAPLVDVLSKSSAVDAKGVTRTYRLYVPPNLPQAPCPLVLVFHGGGAHSRVCRDFDATGLIWEFFKSHPRP